MTEKEKPVSASPPAMGWIGVVFVLLAVSFIADWWPGVPKGQEHAAVDEKFIASTTVRDPGLMQPTLARIDFAYNCNSCHRNFETRTSGHKLIAEHTEIQMNHGINNRCLNCHHTEDRELFVHHDGSAIPWKESELLCQKCHGPKYRDWQAGVHGRPMGYWDSQKGPSTKITCIACHDPHSPVFKPIQPAPGPHDQKSHASEGA